MKKLILQILVKMNLEATKVYYSDFYAQSYKKILQSLTERFLCAINTNDGEQRYED